MSPLWRNQLRIALCPDKVILLGLSRGLRRKVAIQTILPCAPSPGAPGWQAPLAALNQWLQENKPTRMDVTVILSNHFVRYAMMPFSADVTSRAEEATVVQILFEDIYGEPAKQWQLQIGGGGYGEPRLVAAVDTALLEGITAILAPGPLRLKSITPHFISVFNGFHGRIEEADGLFAATETGQMTVAAFRDGRLSSIRRTPLNGNLNEQLPGLLQREILTGGLDMEKVPVYLHVAGQPDIELPSGEGMIIHSLRHVDRKGAPPVSDARFDMAAGGFA